MPAEFGSNAGLVIARVLPKERAQNRRAIAEGGDLNLVSRESAAATRTPGLLYSYQLPAHPTALLLRSRRRAFRPGSAGVPPAVFSCGRSSIARRSRPGGFPAAALALPAAVPAPAVFLQPLSRPGSAGVPPAVFHLCSRIALGARVSAAVFHCREQKSPRGSEAS